MLLPAGFSACGMPLRASKESPQGLALSGASREQPVLPLGLSAPRVVQHPLLQALHPPLAPSPFPKQMPAWGCPHHKRGKGTGAPSVPRAVLWSPAGAGCASGMPSTRGHREGTSAKGSHPDLETLFKHCHSMSWLPRARACTWISAQTQHSLQLLWLPMGTNPRQDFYLFESKQPLAWKAFCPSSTQPHPGSGGNGKDH